MDPNFYYGLMLKFGTKYGYPHHFEDFFLKEVISTSGANFDHCAWGPKIESAPIELKFWGNMHKDSRN